MAEKPIAVIVDDDREWLSMLEDVLGLTYEIEKAKSLSEVDKFLAMNKKSVKIALVDIKLNEEIENEASGLSVMFRLNEKGISCIGVTNYSSNGKVVRDAFVKGRAKDVWFKTENFVDLNEKIKNIEVLISSGRNTKASTTNDGIIRYTSVLLLSTLTIFSLFFLSFFLLQDNFTQVIGPASGFSIIIFLFLALFYRRITGKQFGELFTNIFKGWKNKIVN